MRQQSFKGIKVAQSRANRGMSFQDEIDATHNFYRARGVADIDRNPNEWKFTSPKRWLTFPDRMRAIRECRVTGPGGRVETVRSFLVMSESQVDYSGGGRGFSVAFDAKETGAASLPLANVSEGQIARLCEKERCGVAAGFLVRFTRDGSVYWIGASKVRAAADLARYQPPGRAEHPKSLSQDWLAEHGRQVVSGLGQNVGGYDYLRAAVPEVFDVVGPVEVKKAG